ncbi:MAG: Bug family tripartite tricarboxylate transporter substrate binding protein [Bacillota bacterium]
MTMRSFYSFLAAPFLACALAAVAQEYPTHPVKLVIPQGPGSGADVVGRMLADKLSIELRQPVVVENRPGANGILASTTVMKEPPDGYTLFLTSVSLVSFNQYLYKKVPYTQADFTFIAPVAEASFVLIASHASGIKSWDDLVKRARANPDRVTFASAGVGNSTHLYTEMIARRSGIQLRHIPYNGSGPGLTSVVAGQTDVMVATTAAALPQILGGKVVALAVSGDARSPDLPNVPLLKDLAPSIPALPGWYALVGPAKMDPGVVRKIHAAVEKFVDDPAIATKLTAQYLAPLHGSGADIRKRGEVEAGLWGGLIHDLKIEAD